MKSPNHRLFHVSGKAVIFNPEKTKIILLHNSGGWWTIPGGHIEGDETLEEAVRREVREETGVDYAGELRLAYAERHLAPDGIDKIDLFFVGSLSENTPISVANSGDGLDKWEWASVEKVLAGEYESWQVGILENILAKEERR